MTEIHNFYCSPFKRRQNTCATDSLLGLIWRIIDFAASARQQWNPQGSIKASLNPMVKKGD